MKFIELANKRQSVRKYSDKHIDREKIDRCIEAARIAPSACNSQPWKYIVVDNPELKEKLANETFSAIAPFNKFSTQCPVIVAIVMEKPKMISRVGGKIKIFICLISELLPNIFVCRLRRKVLEPVCLGGLTKKM